MYRLLTTFAALAVSGTAASTPVLFQHIEVPHNLSPAVLASKGGMLGRSFTVQLNRTAIADAVKQGGMWIDLPNGKRVFAASDHQEKEGDGNLSWFGKVSLPSGQRSVVITQGRDAVFGSLVADDGTALQLETRHGVTRLTQPDPRLDMQNQASARLHSDAVPVKLPPPTAADEQRTRQARASAAAGAPSRVDVLVGYNPDLVTSYGSKDAAVTRINYLTSVMNQALQDSQVAGRVHLVGTQEVDYPSDNYSDDVLNDLTNPTGDPRLQPLRDARKRLGADLTSLLRPFRSPEQGSCGTSFVLGGPNKYNVSSAIYGYSVVSDGVDDNSNVFCSDIDFAHELGHNLGLNHEAAITNSPGAYAFDYAWRQSLPDGTGFYTLMAYGTSGQTLAPYYANPRITYCRNMPCGDAATADQARGLDLSMPVAAAFNQRFDANNDLLGDGSADVLYQSDGGITALLYTKGGGLSSLTQPMMAGYHIAAEGDFNGDHYPDLVWTSAAHDLYMWINQGNGSFTQTKVNSGYTLSYALVGSADIDGDGKSDLLFINKTANKFTVYRMDGANRVGYYTLDSKPGHYIAAVGDFDGDGRIDLMWTSAARDLDFWSNNGNRTFTVSGSLPYPEGWSIAGSGDVDNDGRADLVLTNPTTGQVDLWSMDGAVRNGSQKLNVPVGTRVAAVDRFVGATASLLLTDDARQLYKMTNDGKGNFTPAVKVIAYPADPGSYYYNYPETASLVSATPTQP